MRVISKKLITKRNLHEYVTANEGEIYITKEMILTPGAKDSIRDKGITICFGEKTETKHKQVEEILPKAVDKTCEKKYDESMVTREIIRLLTCEYEITDVTLMQNVVGKILERI